MEGLEDEWDCGAGCEIPKESFLKKHLLYLLSCFGRPYFSFTNKYAVN